MSSWDWFVFTHPTLALGLQTHTTTPDFYVGAWGLVLRLVWQAVYKLSYLWPTISTYLLFIEAPRSLQEARTKKPSIVNGTRNGELILFNSYRSHTCIKLSWNVPH